MLEGLRLEARGVKKVLRDAGHLVKKGMTGRMIYQYGFNDLNALNAFNDFNLEKQTLITHRIVTICATLVCMALIAHAEDWPAFRHDNHRSGRSGDELSAALKLKWTYQPLSPPDPAWTAPAKWDAYANNKGLQSLRNIDPAFYVSATADYAFFGSSVDNAVHCLNARTGKEEWVFITGAPVRIAPTLHNHRVLFGSDDGNIYCLNADDGKEVWKFSPAAEARKILNNGNLISIYPCRTGVLIQKERAYFAASLLPWQISYLCSIDLTSGRAEGAGTYVTQHTGLTLQGALLSSETTLYVPQGRSPAQSYDIKTGKALGAMGGMGGVDCLITADGKFIAGPQNQRAGDDVVQIGDIGNRKTVATFPGPARLIAGESSAFYHDGRYLICRDRRQYTELFVQKAALLKQKPRNNQAIAELSKKIKAAILWKNRSDVPLGYALTPQHLVAGFKNSIALYSIKTGEQIWQSEVDGRAYGIAIANNKLFVSTGKGYIHCFAVE